MGKAKKRAKTFNHDKNRRSEWLKKKKQVSIPCKPIKEAWKSSSSVRENLRKMGLSSDPNKMLGLPSTRESIGPKKRKKTPGEVDVQPSSSKSSVVKELEYEASLEAEKKISISEPEYLFCSYMLNRHGDDYKAMARDSKNHYQETPKQIKKKIQRFKNIPEKLKAKMAAQTARTEDMDSS